jgi:hypothetical protein
MLGHLLLRQDSACVSFRLVFSLLYWLLRSLCAVSRVTIAFRAQSAGVRVLDELSSPSDPAVACPSR